MFFIKIKERGESSYDLGTLHGRHMIIQTRGSGEAIAAYTPPVCQPLSSSRAP